MIINELKYLVNILIDSVDPIARDVKIDHLCKSKICNLNYDLL